MKTTTIGICLILETIGALSAAEPQLTNAPGSPGNPKDIPMYKEADWLMNESGDKKSIDSVKTMIGPHTRLITCLARWNGQDATKVVPEALAAGIGLYGFTVPRNNGGLVPLDEFLSRPVSELKGDDRNIAVLARAFHGASIESVRTGKGGFTEPSK